MDQITAMVRDNVAEHGWTWLHELVDGDLPVTYTVGLEPELVLTGAAPVIARPILRELAQVQRSGVKFEPGVLLRDVLTGGYELELRAVAADALPRWMERACEWHGDEGHATFTVLQVVWQDAQHRFPWDEGWDGGEQPLLA